jgi:D-serine deaminase-like pyridoxal phosphate-dependent protein
LSAVTTWPLSAARTTRDGSLRERLDAATADLDPPFAVLDRAAFRANAADLVRRAAGTPVRVASKSVRVRSLLSEVLTYDGWRGVMAFTLAEALWLVRTGVSRDVLVAYPTADRGALAALCSDADLASAVTVMVDDVEQLDLVDSVVAAAGRPPVQVCLELDASWPLPGGRGRVGVRRSPVATPAALASLARVVVDRPGFTLVGLMAYEAQIAGLGDAGRGLRPIAVRALQRASRAEIAERRATAVAAVAAIAPLEFVNGGGTGSLESTSAEQAVTEVTAGSGLFGSALFDRYRVWRPQPAALFALPVVRRPGPGVVTVLGGGWVASGAAGPDRLPTPWLPRGLRLDGREGAGEVQTPLRGAAADRLAIGDRVWFRHAKAGELCEHVDELHVVDGDAVTGTVATYRGEGKAFL